MILSGVKKERLINDVVDWIVYYFDYPEKYSLHYLEMQVIHFIDDEEIYTGITPSFKKIQKYFKSHWKRVF